MLLPLLKNFEGGWCPSFENLSQLPFKSFTALAGITSILTHIKMLLLNDNFVIYEETKLDTLISKVTFILLVKVCYKTKVGTCRFREALKKLMHNNANTIFTVISLIF